MCVYNFEHENSTVRKRTQKQSNSFYLTNDKIVFMKKQTPRCIDSLSSTLEIIFPGSYLGDLYRERHFHANRTVFNSFKNYWEKKKTLESTSQITAITFH